MSRKLLKSEAFDEIGREDPAVGAPFAINEVLVTILNILQLEVAQVTDARKSSDNAGKRLRGGRTRWEGGLEVAERL